MKKKHKNIPIFIPHLGCPNDCVFCNQKEISRTSQLPSKAYVEEVIESAINTATPDTVMEVAFFGGSFTGISIEEQDMYLSAAYTFIKDGRLHGIRCSTRPDYIDADILSRLKSYGVTAIELGVQSLDEDVIGQSKRGHSVQCVGESVRLIKEAGIECGLQMMIGLPGDNYEKMTGTLGRIIDLKPSTIRIYPTIVVKDTELENMFRSGQYQPLTLEEAIRWTADIKRTLKKTDILCIRTGLHSDEGFTKEGMIAGPYHPAFGELVDDYNVMRWIKPLMEGEDTLWAIECGAMIYNRLNGHKRRNREAIYQILKARDVKVNRQSLSVNEGLMPWEVAFIDNKRMLTGTFIYD